MGARKCGFWPKRVKNTLKRLEKAGWLFAFSGLFR
jgi:hypothetical protein